VHLVKRKKKKVRELFLTTFLFSKLTMGRLLNPTLFPVYLHKFFPTPRKSVYKKSLADYFFGN